MATTLRSSAQISNAEFLLPAVGYSGQTQIELESIPISILPNGQLIVESLIDAETLRRVSINAQVQFLYNDIRTLIQSEVVTDTLPGWSLISYILPAHNASYVSSILKLM